MSAQSSKHNSCAVHKPVAVATLLCLALSLVLAGCDSSGKQTVPGAGSPKKLAFVCNNSSSFWTIARAGCQDAEKEIGNVRVDFRIPATGEAAEQQQILNDLVSAGIDGIAVSPKDPANQTEFLNRIAEQTLLICHDSDAPASKRVCYIGTDNTAAGVEAGKLIKEAIPSGGKIMVFVGSMDAQNAKERFAGIKQELAGSNVEIIGVRTDEADNVRAQKNVEDALVKDSDLACLVGLWEYNGPAILNAVRGANQLGKVRIVCFDENADVLAGVAAGEVYGTVVQQPYEFGKQAITKLAKYLDGDKDALAGGKQIVPTRNIKQADAAGYQAELKKLLGK